VTPAATLAILVACAAIGIPIGVWKNSWWRGLLFGLILGPLGLIILLIVPASEETRTKRAADKLRIQQAAAARVSGEQPKQ
jgi:hypothetical protein